MKPAREEILDYVRTLLQELARDWDFTAPIAPTTRLFADLGFDSLDAVLFGTAIQEHYERPMPFAELLADVGQRAQRDLSVGELVDFIDLHLSSTVGGAP